METWQPIQGLGTPSPCQQIQGLGTPTPWQRVQGLGTPSPWQWIQGLATPSPWQGVQGLGTPSPWQRVQGLGTPTVQVLTSSCRCTEARKPLQKAGKVTHSQPAVYCTIMRGWVSVLVRTSRFLSLNRMNILR